MSPRARVFGALSFLVFAAGCGDDETSPQPGEQPLTIPEGCNPLFAQAADETTGVISGDCLLPFPSDFFRTTDGGAPSVVVPEPAQIRFEEVPVDFLSFHRPDGFSVGTPILAVLPAPIDPAPLVFWTGDIARSTTAASPTLLVDADTGQAVPHFAEVDPRASLVPDRQALIIRPLDRLEPGHRYVVGLRGLTKADGTVMDVPAGFASLRDDGGSRHPALQALSQRYEGDVFPVLEAAGVPRGELLLAWDFTTRSEAYATTDLLGVRDDLLARAASLPPPVVVSEEIDPSPHVARRIEMTMTVPLYVDSAKPGAKLVGPAGQSSGTAEVPITVWIPPSVEDRMPGDPPARLLQFGHGFFGDRSECDDFPAQLADEEGFVVVAADWWGMSKDDRGVVLDKLVSDPANTLLFTERLHQGMANFLALAYHAQSTMLALPQLQIGGEPAYDPSAVYFYGISMGHILGGTYVALSPSVERAVLGVGGANFSLMMFRASPFSAFLALISLGNDDPLDQQKFAALAQPAFDRVDPLTYAPYVIRSPLPGAPQDRRVLLHAGIADASVPNLATFFHARVLGVPVLEGASSLVPLGLPTTAAPADGSAFTIFDFGLAPHVEATPPLEGNDVHDTVRRLAASKAQVSAFLRPDGEIEQTCSGVCDPE
ncbi:MAG: hypothetical protein JNL21_09270 [Myxococcales bacterium]|nr:hypothetical protein [Myxococcales bacterium]